MLRRATSMPASTRAWICSALEQAGPMVLTIFARRVTCTTVLSYRRVRIFMQDMVFRRSPIGLAQRSRPHVVAPAPSTAAPPLAGSSRERLDGGRAERLEVLRAAAADERVRPVLADPHLLVDPGGARVAEVGADARIRGHGAAADDVGLDERPAGVADDGDGLARVEERLRELDRLGLGAQVVGVGDAAGQQQAVELGVVGDLHGRVDLEGVGPVEVVERLEATGLGGDEAGGAARLLDGLPRLGELDLLGSLRGAQEGDGLALKVGVGHGFLRSTLALGALPDKEGGMQQM